MPPPLASGDVNSHPELSDWRSPRLSVLRGRLKFVGLRVPKIWLILGYYVKRLGDLDLWPFDLKMGSRITFLTSFLLVKFQFPMPFRCRFRVRYGMDRRTDGRRDDGHQCIMPPYYGGASIKSTNEEYRLVCGKTYNLDPIGLTSNKLLSCVHHSDRLRPCVRTFFYCWWVIPPCDTVGWATGRTSGL